MRKPTRTSRTARTLNSQQLAAATGGALDAGFTIADDLKKLRQDPRTEGYVISDFVWPAS